MALIRSVCRVATKYNWLTRTPSLWTRLLLANTHPSTHPHLYTRLSLLRLLNFPAEAPEAVLLDDSHYGDEDVHAVVCVCKSISGLRLRQTNIACQCGETSVQLQWAGFPTITAVVEVIGLGLGGGGLRSRRVLAHNRTHTSLIATVCFFFGCMDHLAFFPNASLAFCIVEGWQCIGSATKSYQFGVVWTLCFEGWRGLAVDM